MNLSHHSPYLVLARKYRPTKFVDLKGQEALATTLSNSIKFNRIAHAFLLTGIRGVGKTTSARILAKTVNCTNLKQENFIESCGECANCQSVQNDNHPDIIEIDAASKTGVSDAREIIENAKFLPILGKYKIYIIDEVHMLSTNAFNAFLKILEEPPAHVKFIFATTEIRKVPVTIISRCQRFDLRRLLHSEVIEHLENILLKENIEAEKEALAVISENSEGSLRDSLSLLDQAIAYTPTGSKINYQTVKRMLGLTEHQKIISLLDSILKGDVKLALDQANLLYLEGIEPILIIDDLMKIVHLLSKIKAHPESCSITHFSQDELNSLKNIANNLPISSLTIIWQLLLKGMDELKKSSNCLISLEMIIIRICYQADLSKIKVTKEVEPSDTPKISIANQLVIENSSSNLLKPIEHHKYNDFKEIVQLFYDKQELVLYHYLCDEVELISFEEGRIVIKHDSHLPKNFAQQIGSLLGEWTSAKWLIKVASQEEIVPSIKIQKDFESEKLKQHISSQEVVKDILSNFEGAEISKINKIN